MGQPKWLDAGVRRVAQVAGTAVKGEAGEAADQVTGDPPQRKRGSSRAIPKTHSMVGLQSAQHLMQAHVRRDRARQTSSLRQDGHLQPDRRSRTTTRVIEPLRFADLHVLVKSIDAPDI